MCVRVFVCVYVVGWGGGVHVTGIVMFKAAVFFIGTI